MGVRTVVIGLAVSGVVASSCASTARDTLIDIYDDGTRAGSVDACLSDARTFEVATEAFVLAAGRPPSSESDLVPGYLREAPDQWEFDADASRSFVPTADGLCAGVDIDDTGSRTIGQNAVDRIDDARSTACTTNKLKIETALETHFAINGQDATEIGDLTEIDITGLADRWMLEPAPESGRAPSVVPVVGGACDR